MIIDGISATEVPQSATVPARAVAAFLGVIERKLGVTILRDMRNHSHDQALTEPLRLARTLTERGILKEVGRNSSRFVDEPRMKSWYAICNDTSGHAVGGTTWDSEADALYAALAEGLERYIWLSQVDYYRDPIRTTADGIAKKGAHIRPEAFVGFSDAQRTGRPERTLRKDAEYLWIAGTSLITGSPTYIPAQIASRAKEEKASAREPYIRQTTTNGLATWPTRSGARLAGMLELIERESYMMMWLNQLTLPRLSLTRLCADDPSLARGVAICERYRLKTHVIQLITDAPTHVVAVVIEDMSAMAPRFSVGLRAHRSLSAAIKKAMTEALRARRFVRMWNEEGNTWDTNTPQETVGHRERVYYWSVPEHARHLEFLVAGEIIDAAPTPWDTDDEEAHLQRMLTWCRDTGLECISLSLGASAKNPTPWYIEMIVMPEIQPTYLTEPLRAFGGTRWHDIPKARGYTVREAPYAERPHPFA